MTDLTRELLDELTSHRFVPEPARRQVLRSVGREQVAGYVVLAGVHVANGDGGVGTLLRVGIVTATRFVHIAWHEEPVEADAQTHTHETSYDPDDDLDVASQVERFLADTLHDQDAPAADRAPQTGGRLVVTAQTVPLRQVVDVRSTHTYRRRAGTGRYHPDSVRLVVLLPTLDTLNVAEVPCDDEQCLNTHGYEGDAMQDAVMFAATVDRDGDGTVEAVLAFAEALENAWVQ